MLIMVDSVSVGPSMTRGAHKICLTRSTRSPGIFRLQDTVGCWYLSEVRFRVSEWNIVSQSGRMSLGTIRLHSSYIETTIPGGRRGNKHDDYFCVWIMRREQFKPRLACTRTRGFEQGRRRQPLMVWSIPNKLNRETIPHIDHNIVFAPHEDAIFRDIQTGSSRIEVCTPLQQSNVVPLRNPTTCLLSTNQVGSSMELNLWGICSKILSPEPERF